MTQGSVSHETEGSMDIYSIQKEFRGSTHFKFGHFYTILHSIIILHEFFPLFTPKFQDFLKDSNKKRVEF